MQSPQHACVFAPPACSATTDRGRFSFMGGPGGPLWRRITYTLPPLAAHSAARSSAPASARLANGDGAAAVAGAVGGAAARGAEASGAPPAAHGVPGLEGPAYTTLHPAPQPGTVTETDAAGRTTCTASTLWAYLEERLRQLRCRVSGRAVAEGTAGCMQMCAAAWERRRPRVADRTNTSYYTHAHIPGFLPTAISGLAWCSVIVQTCLQPLACLFA